MRASFRILHLALAALLVVLFALSPVSPAQLQRSSVPPASISSSKGDAEKTLNRQERSNKRVTFTSTTIRVLVPVIVTDKNGKHVSGLTRGAFRVFEDGRQQKITNFEEMKPTTVPSPVPASASNVFTNLPNTPDARPRRVVIIALDLINTPFVDQQRMRRAVISYLADTMQPDALYELVAIDSDGMRVIYDYTQDATGLIAALRRVNSELTLGDPRLASVINALPIRTTATVSEVPTATGGKANSDPGPTTARVKVNPIEGGLMMLARAEAPMAQLEAGERAAATLVALRQIAERVEGVQGRKSLVWITGGFPFTMDPQTMHLLADQMISVYPVDARGLLNISPLADVYISAKTMRYFMNAWLTDESTDQREVLDSMRAVADLTGGRAFINTNDTREAIRLAAADGAAYYLLTYAVDKSNRTPGWRKISVKVPNYSVRARPGYFMTQATADPELMAKLDIDTALSSPFEYTGLPVRVFVGKPAAVANKRRVSFALMLPPQAAQVDTVDRNHLNLAIAYLVKTVEGQNTVQKGTSYSIYLDSTQLQQMEKNGVGYSDTIELLPGNYTLNVVVRDNVAGRMGSVTAHLELK